VNVQLLAPGIEIIGVGSAVPERSMTNAEVADLVTRIGSYWGQHPEIHDSYLQSIHVPKIAFETTAEQIHKFTGVHSRHVSDPSDEAFYGMVYSLINLSTHI